MSTKKMSFENTLEIADATSLDIDAIEKTICVCATDGKKRDNAIEFLNARKSICGDIKHKKTKNTRIFKTLKDLMDVLKEEKKDSFVLCTQDVHLSDGIYSMGEISARILKEKKRPSDPSYIPEHGIETIGRKDARGRKMEIFLTFERNPQGFLIKIE